MKTVQNAKATVFTNTTVSDDGKNRRAHVHLSSQRSPFLYLTKWKITFLCILKPVEFVNDLKGCQCVRYRYGTYGNNMTYSVLCFVLIFFF